MGLDVSGGDSIVTAGDVLVRLRERHPLVQLANKLCWTALMDLVLADLKQTTAKGFWKMGRKLLVRVHLAAYLLQKIYNLTDRQTEYYLNDNAAFQLFAGKGLVDDWHAPDHTKIEAFRSRLSPETQRMLANTIAQAAATLGLADPSETDFDSTVQDANIAYPADVNLMTKLVAGAKCGSDYPEPKAKDLVEREQFVTDCNSKQFSTDEIPRFAQYLRRKFSAMVPNDLAVDLKMVKCKARAYWFLARNVTIEKRRAVFKDLHKIVKKQMRPVVHLCSEIGSHRERLPWNIRRAFDQVNVHGWRYLLDVAHFTRKHTIKAGKILAFHAHMVACVKKGKLGKDKQFGRVFQLGRIKGNFLFVGASTSIRMADKSSLVPMVIEHEKLFGKKTLRSVGADKGYWSAKNHNALTERNIAEIGLQPPRNTKAVDACPPVNNDIQKRLRDRRAGIEPLIGRVKHGGQLGRSRMKSDEATLAAGYASVLGFNLRQLTRKLAHSSAMTA